MYPFSLLMSDFSIKGFFCFLSNPTSWLPFEWLMLNLNNACICTLNVVYLLLVILLWLVHIFVQTWDKFDPSIFEENCLSVPSIFHRCYQVLHLHHPGINKRVFHMPSMLLHMRVWSSVRLVARNVQLYFISYVFLLIHSCSGVAL